MGKNIMEKILSELHFAAENMPTEIMLQALADDLALIQNIISQRLGGMKK